MHDSCIRTRRILSALLLCAMAVLPIGGSFAAAEELPSLKELFDGQFRIGVSCEAISHWHNGRSEIGNPEKEELILTQFNSITFGNELKPAYNMDYRSKDATETDLPFVPDRAAIEMLDWAKANQMPVRGHTLIWHSQCEDAIFCKNYKPVYLADRQLDPDCLVDADTMRSRMESYIHHVMQYMYANGYGDVIYAWDVVNEAIETGHNADGFRESYWYQILGSEFLMDAFRFAREAVMQYSVEYAQLYGIDPDDEKALQAIRPSLFYNDYNAFQMGKCKAILKAVQPIAEAGYLDGIGMQGHLTDTADVAGFVRAMKLYAEAVSEVQVTELDIGMTGTGEDGEYRQAVCYRNLLSALLEARKSGVNLTAVTFWGLTDDNSWRSDVSPLLFRADLSAKPAFAGVVHAARGESMPKQ